MVIICMAIMQEKPRPAFGSLLACVAVLAAISSSAPAAQAAGDGARFGQVILPSGKKLQVEIADSPMRRQRGYMFRDAVGPEDGMLFVFEDDDFHSFWMKNVTFELDILWLTPDGEVVDQSLRTPPCKEDPCGHYQPLARARYVLELAGGRAKKLGMQRGDVLELLLPLAARDR